MPRFVTPILALVALVLLLRAGPAAAKKLDRCFKPAEIGPCKAAVPRWAFDPTTGKCNKFVWGGCKPGKNNFKTKAACKAACNVPTCDLPAAVGSGSIACLGYFPRWAYDSKAGKCKEFIYGGCGGNKNNFTSKKKCEETCKPTPSPCELPAVPGPCEAYIPSWYFNSSTKQCEEFVYGGCQGNDNRFPTKEECEGACPDEA